MLRFWICNSSKFLYSFGFPVFPQCEKEFHVGCLKDHGLQDLKVPVIHSVLIYIHIIGRIIFSRLKMVVYQELPQGMWFCCEECDRINATLEKLVVSGEEELPDTPLNVLTKKQNEEGPHFGAQPEIKWRVLNGKMASSEDTELLLSTAITIFQVSVRCYYVYTCK